MQMNQPEGEQYKRNPIDFAHVMKDAKAQQLYYSQHETAMMAGLAELLLSEVPHRSMLEICIKYNFHLSKPGVDRKNAEVIKNGINHLQKHTFHMVSCSFHHLNQESKKEIIGSLSNPDKRYISWRQTDPPTFFHTLQKELTFFIQHTMNL